MNTPQTRFLTLSAMKVTNTEHTAINGNHSKCRMTLIKKNGQYDLGWLYCPYAVLVFYLTYFFPLRMYIPLAADTVDSFLPLRSWMSSDVVERVL